MRNDNDEIFEEIVEHLDDALQHFAAKPAKTRIYRKVRRQANMFNLKKVSDKEFIYREILASQNRSIVNAIKDKQSIRIPRIGMFKFRQYAVVASEIKQEIYKKHGITTIFDLPKSERLAVVKEVKEASSEIVKQLYIESLNPNKSIILNSFKVPNEKKDIL